MIKKCTTVPELNKLYKSYPEMYIDLEQDFKSRKKEISKNITSLSKSKSNGTSSIA